MFRYTEKTGNMYLCLAAIGDSLQFLFFSDDEPSICLEADDIEELVSLPAKNRAISLCNAF